MKNKKLTGKAGNITTIIPIKFGTERSLNNVLGVLKSQPNKNCVVIVSLESEEEEIFDELKNLERKYRNLKIVISGESGSRMGKAHNMNEAFKFVETEFVAFKDDDVTITKNNYIDFFSKFENSNVGGGFAPAFYCTDGKPDKMIEIITNYYFTEQLIKFAEGLKLNFCAGAFMMFRKEAIDNSGGLEKILYNIADDASLGKLLSSKGYSILLSDIPVYMESEYSGIRSTAQHINKWMVIIKKFLGKDYYFLPFTFQLSNVFWLSLMLVIFFAQNIYLLMLPLVIIIDKIITSLYIDSHFLKKRFNIFHYISIVILGIFQTFAWIISLPQSTIVWAGKKYKIGKGGKIHSIIKI
ncbi:MAG TPA: glycosyltransferase family 2 protein [Ignavibacteriaceae bacterium]|nr:glycosyltransferase family 2 protein [Ignavibacteriaceae bacterium]